MKRKAPSDTTPDDKAPASAPPLKKAKTGLIPDLETKTILRAPTEAKTWLAMEARSLLSWAGAKLFILSEYIYEPRMCARLTSTLHSGLDSLMCQLERPEQLERADDLKIMRKRGFIPDGQFTNSYKRLSWHDPERRGIKPHGSKYHAIVVSLLIGSDGNKRTVVIDGTIDIQWSFDENAHLILGQVLAQGGWLPGTLQRLICSYADPDNLGWHLSF